MVLLPGGEAPKQGPAGPGRRKKEVSAPAPNPASDALKGKVVGDRYRLVSVIGEGGMGTVYLAEHITIGKKLAVKVLATEFARQQSYRRRFLREAQAICQISHQNVIEVTDFGVAHGSLYLVMEFLRGEGLSETLSEHGYVSWVRAKPIILQICEAISAAHEKGILHRDIKPENCFRIKRGDDPDFIKVLDFGLAKILGSSDQLDTVLTGSGRVIGTAEYMSPEQIKGEKLDPRSDIYSVGVLIYELVTGCVPFSAPHYTMVMDQHLYALAVPPSQATSGVQLPPELDPIIVRCLQKDRDARYSSMRELVRAVAAIPAPYVPLGMPITQTTSLPVPMSAPPMHQQGTLPAFSPAELIPAASKERLYLTIIAVLGALVVVLTGLLIAVGSGLFPR